MSNGNRSIQEGHCKFFIYAVALISLGIFFAAYSQSLGLKFRVEQWEVNHFYATYSFNPFSLDDWLKIAVWTPFRDFRMIPLAYIWNFLVFKLFGIRTYLYWLLSVLLTLANCLLLARLLAMLRGKQGVLYGLFAAALFLLFPAKFEAIIWTLFTYKLFWAALILLTLILFEGFLQTLNRRYLFASVGLLFISWFFYEASLPVGITLGLRTFLWKQKLKNTYRLQTFGLVLITYCLYGVSYLLLENFARSHYDMYFYRVDLAAVLPKLLPAFFYWIFHALILANAGLTLTLVAKSLLKFTIMPQAHLVFWLVLLWGTLLINSRSRAFPWRDILYLLIVAVSGSLLVLVGRTATNGIRYMGQMSVYQYYPTLFLAAIVGYLIHNAFEYSKQAYRKTLILVCFVSLLGLLGRANYLVIREYLGYNRMTLELIKNVGLMIEQDPNIRISPGRYIRLPFTPRYAIADEEHVYNILHLLYGDNIVHRE